ncbi:cytochrome P450 [Aspergillus ambiguus]|uniref:cytochrome P450 n=1 Tax=Aspergillus ambiguus TaxID=176160 RepID=UPI003CCE4FCA
MLITLQILVALYLVYVGLSAVRNVYLHPLRHIPGPKAWIAFPILRHVAAVRGRFDVQMRAYHAKYGDVVRFGPDEVSFITPQAWPAIYGHGSQLPKVLNSSSNTSDILSAHHADHARFRKALSPAFSAKGLQAQEPLLLQYVDQLVERLRGVAESQLATDMVKWYNLTTFDLIGDLAFGEPFGGLQNAEYHHWVATIFEFVRVIPLIKAKDRYPLLFKAIMAVLPRSLVEAQKRQRAHTRITVQKRLHSQMDRTDFMDSMLRHRGKKEGLTDEEIEANANILIIAGSETTATLLSGLTYWLLRTPTALQRVTEEVRSTMQREDEITMQTVSARLPYLLACINEGFRMYPPVPTGLQRRTPASHAIEISGYKIRSLF